MDTKWLNRIIFSNNPLKLVDLLREETTGLSTLLKEAK